MPDQPRIDDEQTVEFAPHVLVVDDDRDVTTLLAHLLGRAGMHVTVRSNGADGLATARELVPDVVVLDWSMPVMTGVHVCRALRSAPDRALSRVPVLVLTARDHPAERQLAMAAGADDFLVKPFRPGDLVQRVSALLAQRRPVDHDARPPAPEGG